MLGLMQDWPMTVDRILDHADRWHGDREVISRSVEGPIVRTTWSRIHSRARQVTHALKELGIQPGDRVATLGWNTARHIETWYGVMGMGAVCHTLNPRLHPDQIMWIASHAGDRILFTDLTFLPMLLEHLHKAPCIERVVILSDEAHRPDGAGAEMFMYEDLIAGRPTDAAWGGFDENTACGLCYTSGTTGDPKGVLYSHRSNFLHTFMTLQTDVMGLSQRDTVLAVVPMFHANAWGLTFSAPAVGASFVLPGARMDGPAIHELLQTEQVTMSAAVPTVWQMLLQHLDASGDTLTHLKRVVIGGSAVPEAIVRAFHDRFGVKVVHAWGMTETSPLGTLGTPTAAMDGMDFETQLPILLKQGRPPLGIDIKLVNDTDESLPRDGATFGRLLVKGPTVVQAYFRGAAAAADADGYFDTGDVATIDTHGFMQITDRAKDVIKSGGEWISSIDIENIAAGHPKAALAAVIGVYHPKWDERPLLLVKLKDGVTATRQEFLDFLAGKIAKWWTPDDVVFVDDIPLGATGKIDKKVLRQRFGDYVLPTIHPYTAKEEAVGEPE
jgi:fatty-acyl-CoA synthase